MKLFAILKDSFREAIDSKLFYATAALSCLVILFVASVSYRPLAAEEQFRYFATVMNFAMSMEGKGKGAARMDIVDFQQTNGAAEPWRGDYQFVFVIESANEAEAELVRRHELGTAQKMQDAFRRGFFWYDNLEVRDAPSANPKETRYLVTTKGTKVKDRRQWPHEVSVGFGTVPLKFLQILNLTLADEITFIMDKVIGTFGAGFIMLVSTIITASFIPNMLRKGTVDLLLAKPIHRSSLLLYKFLGGLTFMFLNTVLIMAGLYVVLGLRTGLWLPSLLWCIAIFTFQFAIFYAVSTLAAVLTRSTVVAILASVVTWGLLVAIGWIYYAVDLVHPDKLAKNPQAQRQVLPAWVYLTAEIVYRVSPRYKEIDWLTGRFIDDDLVDPASRVRPPDAVEVQSFLSWPQSLGVTSLFIAGVLGLACWWFAWRDY